MKSENEPMRVLARQAARELPKIDDDELRAIRGGDCKFTPGTCNSQTGPDTVGDCDPPALDCDF